ncbi:phosphopantetheine-binding protein [Nocardia terpenica]|uniref:Isochorismatase n=1 Tax=Nocardia terpenica TaxID=455432 RepID=A0A291RG08_9NOCA|nr:phosphopantetheine-binding protein [Nocardia terpenica]ATL66297.1 isochorismatase [Nocardia terpenica]QIS18322.1 isochorismatase [Nocardia terpenica]
MNSHEVIRTEVAQVLSLRPEEIGDDHNLADLGMTSMELMGLVNRWRKRGLRVSFDTLVEKPTLAAWVDHLEAVS